MSEGKVDILCQNLWKVFGSAPESAWDVVNNGVTRQEVLEHNSEGSGEP